MAYFMSCVYKNLKFTDALFPVVCCVLMLRRSTILSCC